MQLIRIMYSAVLSTHKPEILDWNASVDQPLLEVCDLHAGMLRLGHVGVQQSPPRPRGPLAAQPSL